jgi:hypothetical protein
MTLLHIAFLLSILINVYLYLNGEAKSRSLDDAEFGEEYQAKRVEYWQEKSRHRTNRELRYAHALMNKENN